jgi:IS30 family transposase
LLRQYFPSGKTVAHYTQDHLDMVAAQLNGRPRETLGWKSPARKVASDLIPPRDK